LQIISVRSFENKATASEYFRLINSNADVFKSIEGMEYSLFIISLDNFETFKQNKSASTYLKFFEENYIKEEERRAEGEEQSMKQNE